MKSPNRTAQSTQFLCFHPFLLPLPVSKPFSDCLIHVDMRIKSLRSMNAFALTESQVTIPSMES